MTIYLYHKQCSHCGLNYFGKTKNNPYTYNGSGLYWKRHIKFYKIKPKTVQVWEFSEQNDATKFAIDFSKENNIVKSGYWANMCEENALNGGSAGRMKRKPCSKETAEKISRSNKGKPKNISNFRREELRNKGGPMKGRVHTEESKEKMRNRPCSEYTKNIRAINASINSCSRIITPEGVFDSIKLASEHYNKPRGWIRYQRQKYPKDFYLESL